MLFRSKDNLLFKPSIADKKRFILRFPHRYAVKQLHSKQNPERLWSSYVFYSINFALYELNELFSSKDRLDFVNSNTLILVYGAEEGATAALKTAEADVTGKINGIVAVNPQIQPNSQDIPLTVETKKSTDNLSYHSLPDYSTYAALYIPCAIPAIKPDQDLDDEDKRNDSVPYASNFLFSENRCRALRRAKLLTNTSPEEALNKLHEYSWKPEMDIQLPYFYFNESIAFPYKFISSYGRFDVTENMCDFSVASTQQDPLFNSGEVKPLKEVNFAEIWALSKGIYQFGLTMMRQLLTLWRIKI